MLAIWKREIQNYFLTSIGYVFMGIGLGTEDGVAAAIFQILAHAFAKPLLFVSAGRLSAVTGHEKQLAALRGSAWRDTLAGFGFAFGALSMVGVPLFGGFAAKFGLASAAGVATEKAVFPGDRAEVRAAAVRHALAMLESSVAGV